MRIVYHMFCALPQLRLEPATNLLTFVRVLPWRRSMGRFIRIVGPNHREPQLQELRGQIRVDCGIRSLPTA